VPTDLVFLGVNIEWPMFVLFRDYMRHEDLNITEALRRLIARGLTTPRERTERINT
jgi:hypothetical protein